MHLLSVAQKIISPTYCTSCSALGKSLCSECSKMLSIQNLQICIACENFSINGTTHTACLERTKIASLHTPFVYSKTVRKIIVQAKESQRSYTLLNDLLLHAVNQNLLKTLPTSDIIVPVPSSKGKKRVINHAKYIAEYIGQTVCDVLLKHPTEQQKSLTSEHRWHGKNQFYLKKGANLLIKDKRVLLIDDVTTTGATFSKCAEVLSYKRASEIHCYALAKDLRLRYNSH